MRLSDVLVVAAATTLLASDHAVYAVTNLDKTSDILTMESPALVTSLKDGNVAGGENRFLRINKGEDDEDDMIEEDEDEVKDEDEERARGSNLFKTSKLNEMLSSVKTFKRFSRWKAQGYTPTDIYHRLGSNPKYKDLYAMYNMNYASI